MTPPKLERPRRRLADTAKFLTTWSRKPLQTGAVAPSSHALARLMASHVDTAGDLPVIEIGPGTGPVTEALVRRGVAERRLVLVEFNPDFVALLRRRFPLATVVEGDAYSLEKTIGNHLAGKSAAAVVSSLPLLTRPESVRLELLEQAYRLLRPGAPFIQFTYGMVSPLPLKKAGSTWRASRRIWLNVPPARVWVYCRPAA